MVQEDTHVHISIAVCGGARGDGVEEERKGGRKWVKRIKEERRSDD